MHRYRMHQSMRLFWWRVEGQRGNRGLLWVIEGGGEEVCTVYSLPKNKCILFSLSWSVKRNYLCMHSPFGSLSLYACIHAGLSIYLHTLIISLSVCLSISLSLPNIYLVHTSLQITYTQTNAHYLASTCFLNRNNQEE